jgi:hypothetical protein
MAITSYTSYDAIRALLGVAATELEDDTLALPMYEDQFLLELSDIDGGGSAVTTLYATILAIEQVDRTTNQQRFFTLVNLLGGYSVARQLLASSELFAPKRITDGAAAVERAGEHYDRLREGIQASYNIVLSRIKTLLATLDGSAEVATRTSRTFITSTGLATDPVTGV